MNADPRVMEHFPSVLSKSESENFLERLKAHYNKHGYTYFAVEHLELGELIGFVGMAYQEYESEFTPATDIGWRLKYHAWGNGFATEGALRCVHYAFEDLKLDELISTCTGSNRASERIMQKIGMKKQGSFLHPKLKEYPEIQECIWYKMERPK